MFMKWMRRIRCVFLLFSVQQRCYRERESVCEITKQRAHKVFVEAVKPASGSACVDSLCSPAAQAQALCDVAPKMPGLCTPGLVLRENKTKWPRLFKVGISRPQGENCTGRVQVC